VKLLVFILVLLPLSVASAAAQAITTGSISGTVVDQQGGTLPGASVVAVHTPTGTAYETVADGSGRFTLLNVRVGGPYTITAKLAGFKDEAVKDVTVALGEDRAVRIKLSLANVTETVQVTAETLPIDPTRAGAGANIPNTVKEVLPTIQRSIYDIARVSPLFNAAGGGAGDGASVVSVAGSSFRYNTLQIDGALNNDLFGLAGSAGTPGGAMETQPIAFDAIQEIQLVVSPYDVRQGGFSGGGINAITKSGSNTFHGSGFYFGRNQKWVGKGADNRAIASFSEKQGGGSLGGKLITNRAFFFGSADSFRRQRPVGVSVGGSGVQFAGSEALVDQYLSILKNTYGYDVGANAKAEYSRTTNNDKVFGRLDFNLGKGHQLTVRHNFVNALNDIGTPSDKFYKTPDNYYRFVDKTRSSVGQLNSAFGKGVNELRVAYTTVRDHREPQPFETRAFPQVNVTLATGVTIQSGREQFSTANELDQNILEVTDSFTIVKGGHALTIGTSNQFFDFRNLFIRDNFGTYSFSSLANFAAGQAQQFDYSFSATSNPKQAAAFGVRQWSAYAGDQWRARSNVTITAGVRFDATQFPDKPAANPVAVNFFDHRTDIVPENMMWSPRFGFNYDIRGDGVNQVRGGIGMFAGRPPYVWVSNQFGNTGVDFTRIGAGFNTANRIPFVADASNQPKTVSGATAGSFSNEIDFIDPDFKYPSVYRGNLAWDRKLPWGLYSTAEFVASRTINDIKYQNYNYTNSVTTTGVGGRPFYIKRYPALSDGILLTNTHMGYNWTASYEVRRPFKDGWYFSAAYSYNEAKTLMDGTSDQAASNWGNVYTPGDPNNPPLARSNFAVGHRINASAAREIGLVKGTKLTLSAFYSGQSGRPYTLAFGRDVNGDGRGTNDLLYIPSSATDGGFTYTGGSYNDLLTFIEGDGCLKQYVGKIIPRNACRAPWTNTLDGRAALALPFKKVKAEITLDAFNLINLLDSKGGLFKYASFNEITVIQPVPTSVTAISPLTGYNLSGLTATTFTKFLRDDLRSRWQLQLGGRISF
jgi:hypothetical protein